MLAIKRHVASQKFYTYSGAAVLMILTTTTAIRVLPQLGQFIASAPASRSDTSHASSKNVTDHQTTAGTSQTSNHNANSQPLRGGTAASGQVNDPAQSLSGQLGSSASNTLTVPSRQSAPTIPSDTSSAWSQSQPVTGSSASQPAASQPEAGSPPSTGSSGSDPMLQLSLPLLGTNLSLL